LLDGALEVLIFPPALKGSGEGSYGWDLKPNSSMTNATVADSDLMPARTQITRHDCVEGWSAIGKWTGVPLPGVLRPVDVLPAARYVKFHCADKLETTLDRSGGYYESIDLVDAFHPQTILAYGMNGENLSVTHSAPARRATARLQASEISDADRAGRQPGRHRRRQRGILGRPWLRVVRGNLNGSVHGTAHRSRKDTQDENMLDYP
jgi:hypothetical protein